jgi:hypothetical protein
MKFPLEGAGRKGDVKEEDYKRITKKMMGD